ncbi:MAG: hypothetical protein ACXIUW_07150 [Roseinatronobacter sp.]
MRLRSRFSLKPTIMVVGTFRSGTNLMKHVLETYFHARVVFSEWFWKHGVPPTALKTPVPRHVPIITVTKDPVALNESLYAFWRKRRPELDIGRNLSEFVQRPFIVYDNTGGLNNPQYLFATPTDYWNQYHFSWTHWAEIAPRHDLVRIEAFQADPAGVLAPIVARIGLRARDAGPISLPRAPVRSSQDIGNTRLDHPRPQSSATPAHDDRERLSPEDKAVIRRLVNREIAHRLGYSEY